MNERYKEIKKQLGITDADVARMFGYKGAVNFRTSTRKDKVVSGFIQTVDLITSKYQIMTIKADTINEAVNFLLKKSAPHIDYQLDVEKEELQELNLNDEEKPVYWSYVKETNTSGEKVFRFHC